ncbi:MAG: GGDEF domain-containing protein [Brevundimonas sp.]|nr:MAG: GGDEF domain-containing protein [Brevundimonas sp.]
MTDTAEADDLTAEIERLRAEVEKLRARAEAAEAAADHDVLTPVLNRRGFVAAMRQAMALCQRHGTTAVLLYLDLDGFKSVNDQLGHAAGDAALVHVADMLHLSVRESDSVGRLGGDEFGLLMLNASFADGKEKARKLSEQLDQEPFFFEGETTSLGGSFGVREWTGHTDPEVWLAEADAAMWIRKRAPRDA